MVATPAPAASINNRYGYIGLKEGTTDEPVPVVAHSFSFQARSSTGGYMLEDKPLDDNCRLIPPAAFTFELLFLRMMYQRMDEHGYFSKEHKGVHISVFRRCMRRLLDMFNSDMTYDFEAFGGVRNAVYIRWEDIRVATDNDRLPSIELMMAERIFMVLEGRSNSILGNLWGIIIFVAIIANVALITVTSLEDDVCGKYLHDPSCHYSMDICSVVFSIDYVGRLVCSPWCRHGIFNIDWLIDHVVVDPMEVNQPMPKQASPFGRLWFFVAVPMHVVDLLSIIPFWLNLLAGCSRLPLGFLRSLRLLRLFRVMKFGKFSRTLLVLGDTFRKSSQSIGVLVLYIVMVALMAGAVMYRFEKEAGSEEESFATVPAALWWVVCRMVSMQHSLPGAHGIPITWVSSLVVACVGMFRGVIFVLPIGQITTAFKDAWGHQQIEDQLKHEVQKSKELPMGYEWTEDPTSPVVRVELHHCLSDGTEHDIDAYGTLPLPLYKAEVQECCIWVKMHGSDMVHPFFGTGHPEIYFHLVWTPAPDTNAGEKVPHGNLHLRLLQGRDFPGNEQLLWGCRVSVPVRLHGEGSNEFWNSGPSSTGSPRPDWSHCGQLQYEIKWTPPRGSLTPPGPSDKAKQEAFQQRVLQLLEEQSARIAELERELKDARFARLAC